MTAIARLPVLEQVDVLLLDAAYMEAPMPVQEEFLKTANEAFREQNDSLFARVLGLAKSSSGVEWLDVLVPSLLVYGGLAVSGNRRFRDRNVSGQYRVPTVPKNTLDALAREYTSNQRSMPADATEGHKRMLTENAWLLYFMTANEEGPMAEQQKINGFLIANWAYYCLSEHSVSVALGTGIEGTLH